MSGIANHVHLLVDLGKTVAIAELLMHVKKDPSKWIKTKPVTDRGFQWQDGYAGFSVGQSQVTALRGYFAKQKEKHRRMTFQEELLALLKKYEVDRDARYIWD